jgi:type IV pilus assembly protein PilP
MAVYKLQSPRQLFHALFSVTVPWVILPPASLTVGRTGSIPAQMLPPSLSVATWVVFMALLAGCGNNDFSDLNRYISEVKARPKEPIKPLAEIKAVEPFIFKPEGLRDPFRSLEQVEQAEGGDATPGNGIKPDTTRRKEELEAFPLDGLKMVGTVNIKSSLWGLIKASDGTIYRVKVGNYMGKNYGKIIRIVSDKIELMEIVPDKPGTWREQQATIKISE